MEDLQMAKKRDHKIMITDEAIEKVPHICYKGIPENEYDIIQELARAVLRLSKDKNDSNEISITYRMGTMGVDAEDEIFGVSFGDEHSVDPLQDALSYHILMSSLECVVISLHNHPSASKISLEDVRFFLEYENVKMMVIVTNLGNIFYMTKGDRYDRSVAIKIYNEAVSAHYKAKGLKGYQEAAEQFQRLCHTAGIFAGNH